MADSYVVEIDMEKLRASLEADGDRIVTLEDTEAALREAGFRKVAKGWLCEEISLRWLARDEIKSIRPG